MRQEAFLEALQDTHELELTVTGRHSGRAISNPVWFVQDGARLYLVPIYGTDSAWYKNIKQHPTVQLRADGYDVSVVTAPIEDATRTAEILDAFRAKYGSENFERYYPKPEVAVEIPLG